MAYKFNRGCWVESSEERLAGASGRTPDSRSAALRSTLETRIRLAKSLYDACSGILLQEPRIRMLMKALDRGIERSHRAMDTLGVSSGCARCDATAAEGSCCSRGLDRKYDAILLLANLLMGREIDLPPRGDRDCRFLGPTGCRLTVRHMLCVEYLCPALENELGPERLALMQEATGDELEAGFLLCDAIKRYLAARPT